MERPQRHMSFLPPENNPLKGFPVSGSGQVSPSGLSMAVFRVLFIDVDGHVSRALEIKCNSEAEALEHLARFKHISTLELWQDARLLKRIEKPA